MVLDLGVVGRWVLSVVDPTAAGAPVADTGLRVRGVRASGGACAQRDQVIPPAKPFLCGPNEHRARLIKPRGSYRPCADRMNTGLD